MSSRVVKCGVSPAEGLVTTILDQGRLICSNCGTIVSDLNKTDKTFHIFYEYVGAYCQLHQTIHYRWVMNDWELMEEPILRKRKQHEPIIIAKKTEVGAEKYFMKSQRWRVLDEQTCCSPGYKEVLWSDFDESKLVLLRPQDTGYLKINSRGIHTPFIGALFEWLLNQDQWSEIAELSNNSGFIKREKKIINKTISQPTPSNIFKFIWTMKRFIPGWHHKRSLGKRSPSMLIIDEIRWTTNRLKGMEKVDKERLLRYGPEPQYWNVWPDLWPKDVDLADNLADFGPELKRIGIHYGDTLTLIKEPNQKNEERSWMEIADKMIQWPISYSKGGNVDQFLSIRDKQGFVSNLINNLQVTLTQEPETPGKWEEYLLVNLPLIWQQNGGKYKFETIEEIVSKTDLQKTLKVLQPWIAGEVSIPVILKFTKLEKELIPFVKSFKSRLKLAELTVEY